ncbi:MAG: hypothetical protein KAG14_01000 [Mycoplasmataceae bacterium]|nr:hypothetical protein [Mycoplasmataceae bacterium]
MGRELQIINKDINDIYKDVINDFFVKEISFDEYIPSNLLSAVNLLNKQKDLYVVHLNKTKAIKIKLIDERNKALSSYGLATQDAIEEIYNKIDSELEILNIKHDNEKEFINKLVSSQISIVTEFRQREKELVQIIEEAINAEKTKQEEGNSHWSSIGEFSKNIKSNTLPQLEKEREEKVNPALKLINEHRMKLEKIEKVAFEETKKINLHYNKEILKKNKTSKKEELKIIELHRETVIFLETQLSNSRKNARKVNELVDDIRMNMKRKAIKAKADVIKEIRIFKKDFEYSDIDDALDSFNKANSSIDRVKIAQKELKQLSGEIRKSIISNSNNRRLGNNLSSIKSKERNGE